MALLAATLGTQLANMTPQDTEAAAISNLATAFDTYFQGATVAGIPVTPGSTAGAKAAMSGALVGISAPGAGAAKIQAGIIAYWGAVVPAAVTIWVTVPPIISATPPPGLAGIAAAITPVFASNQAGDLPLATAANNVANAIHPTQLGGIAVIGPPPPGGTPTPIL